MVRHVIEKPEGAVQQNDLMFTLFLTCQGYSSLGISRAIVTVTGLILAEIYLIKNKVSFR